MAWRKAWRVNRFGSMVPEQVEIMDAAGDFVLVKGEDHTVWRGSFFSSPEAAFDAAITEEERSLVSGQQRLDRLHKAKARHCS